VCAKHFEMQRQSQDKRKTTWYCNVNTIRSSLKGNGNGVVMKM